MYVSSNGVMGGVGRLVSWDGELGLEASGFLLARAASMT